MKDLLIEQEIINFINEHPYTRWTMLNKTHKQYYDYLIKRYYDCFNVKEAFLRIKNNIDEHPKCCVCGGPAKFIGGNKNYIYAETCSKECKKKYVGNILHNKTKEEKEEIKKKKEETCIKRYGKKHYINIEKTKRTNLERYGDENYNNKEKHKQTCIKKYGVEWYVQTNEFKDKSKQTCLERYGVEYSQQSEEIRNKTYQTWNKKYGVNGHIWSSQEFISKSKATKLERYGDENYSNHEQSKATKLERYGDENYNNKEKAKATSLEKYGVEHFTNHEQSKATKLERYGDENYNNINKCILTNINKYGVSHVWKISNIHDRAISKEALNKKKNTCLKRYGVEYVSQSKEIQEKSRLTKYLHKTDKTFKTEEDKIYEKLCEIYPNTKRQYDIDIRYPHACDFYIPELDMFIEYNAYPTHGGHPFNKTNKDDLNKVEWLKTWKPGHGDYITFTERDPQKRKDAKDNNLNFIELWNLKEAYNFVDKLKEKLLK